MEANGIVVCNNPDISEINDENLSWSNYSTFFGDIAFYTVLTLKRSTVDSLVKNSTDVKNFAHVK